MRNDNAEDGRAKGAEIIKDIKTAMLKTMDARGRPHTRRTRPDEFLEPTLRRDTDGGRDPEDGIKDFDSLVGYLVNTAWLLPDQAVEAADRFPARLLAPSLD